MEFKIGDKVRIKDDNDITYGCNDTEDMELCKNRLEKLRRETYKITDIITYIDEGKSCIAYRLNNSILTDGESIEKVHNMELKNHMLIRLTNKEDLMECLEECEKQGYKWASGDSPSKEEYAMAYFNVFNEDVCVEITGENLLIGSTDSYRKTNRKITEYKDLKQPKRVKNIDKVKDMSSFELMMLLTSDTCEKCAYKGTDCNTNMCEQGVRDWLEQDVEIEIKDVLAAFEKQCNDDCIDCNCLVCLNYFILENYNINNGKITKR